MLDFNALSNPVHGGTPPTTGGMTAAQIFDLKGLWKWWQQNGGNGTHFYNGVSEKGIDFSNDFGTPIGVLKPGVVVRIVHNNNSIGDVVEIQCIDGSVWLYQHIDRRCSVGQALNTGDIVGLEDGLPVDQYSTGPHIEVRVCPVGWSSSIDSWNEPWVNPKPYFAAAAGELGSVSSSNGNPFGINIPAIFTSVSQQAHQTLNNVPGFYGVALAIDQMEQFTPFQLPNSSVSIGPISVPNPVALPSDTIQAALVFAVDNIAPALFRGGLMLIGMIMIIALAINLMSEYGPMDEAAQIAPQLIGAMA